MPVRIQKRLSRWWINTANYSQIFFKNEIIVWSLCVKKNGDAQKFLQLPYQ